MTDDQSDAAPDPPESLPAYVATPLERQSADRLGEVIEYASALIDYREQQARRDFDADDLAADDEEIVEIDPNTVGATVVKRVPCGKANCSTCPHGPYKYRVYPDGNGGQRWDYRGPVAGDADDGSV
jgi:hypothetical protein